MTEQAAKADATPVRVVPRDMLSSDQEFVVDSWRKSWRQSPEMRREGNPAFHAMFEEIVLRRLLGADRAQVLVAANDDDHNEIVGWICYTPQILIKDVNTDTGVVTADHADPVIHYVYVRHRTRATHQTVRKTGLFSALLGLVGVRERFVYTFRPGERTHRWGVKAPNVEQALLAWAERVGLKPAYEPILSWLGPREEDAPAATATPIEEPAI